MPLPVKRDRHCQRDQLRNAAGTARPCHIAEAVHHQKREDGSRERFSQIRHEFWRLSAFPEYQKRKESRQHRRCHRKCDSDDSLRHSHSHCFVSPLALFPEISCSTALSAALPPAPSALRPGRLLPDDGASNASSDILRRSARSGRSLSESEA